jgi:hypothetical protein
MKRPAPEQGSLLSFAEARFAGQAMYNRYAAMTKDKPPLDPQDAAWADLARCAWDTVQARRRGPRPKDNSGKVKGGLARAAALSPERRSEIARKAAKARWGK